MMQNTKDKTAGANFLIGPDDRILVTGATGFIGSKVVHSLLERGFRNIRCFARPTSDLGKVTALGAGHWDGRVEVVRGNLLSREDCRAATSDVDAIVHLAAMRGEKSFAEAFLNSVVTTRNLLESAMQERRLRRFVNVSSFTVYTNSNKRRWRMLDESCPVEGRPELRGDSYCYAKTKQDELVEEYGRNFGIPYVIVRPGAVYGPGNEAITSRVGIGTFGVFLHLGSSNKIPLTYVDNCADAIALAAVTDGIDGQVFNVVDDDLPSSRKFLRSYKRNVKWFPSLYVPHALSYALCWLWEKYSSWSEGQLPPAYNVRGWHASWKKTSYSNAKLKSLLGWSPKVSTADALARYFEACRRKGLHA